MYDLLKVNIAPVLLCLLIPHIEGELERFSMQDEEGLFRMTVQTTKSFELAASSLKLVVPRWHLSTFVQVQVRHESGSDVDGDDGDQKIGSLPSESLHVLELLRVVLHEVD